MLSNFDLFLIYIDIKNILLHIWYKILTFNIIYNI